MPAPIHSELLQAVANGRDAMVALAIPTENPPGSDYGQMTELLCRRLNDLGFRDTQVIDNCVLSFLGEGERTIYFSGHYDVIPAQGHRQFEPVLKGRVGLVLVPDEETAGPGGSRPNEFVPIDRMVECAQVYALAARELLA